MPEHISLSQLNSQIKEAIEVSFPDTVWVIAEISEIRTVRSGHCYLELIEKDETTDTVKAKARATIWAFTYRMLKPYFETTTKQELTSGLKVLIRASVEFQEVYGFSLNIKDIDPSYTLGDIARKRLEVIRKLEEEGVMDMNKEVELATVPQKLAVISSPTAAGYEDFINQLENNPYAFKIYHKLFKATMQGNEAEQSIISALERIYAYEDFFDAVIIIRGGGSTADLMCFDGYWLALNIAQFPLPVLTGIGHERDESVADMVAHTRLKTPTAVAEFIVDRISDFNAYLDDVKEHFIDEVTDQLKNQKHRLDIAVNTLQPIVSKVITQKRRQPLEAAQRLNFVVKSYFDNQQLYFTHVKQSLHYLVKKQVNSGLKQCQFHHTQLKIEVAAYLKNASQKLLLAEKTTKLSDPENVLERGYSITYKEQLPLKSTEQIKEGDVLHTKLQKGLIISKVEKIIK
ncbi:exodeoxyribonuclease VII large subunit [Carboxylicivirga caseinilyticus]|uniref:exodeoxyribonuclease VII large subunit n=1 Tax=Carboxylicivirga caseinilyticus TaxID=3417572 RepID=UPI003D3509C5|nr:exodeoxyribonuclease VII large subunit [Marinilabiliaceae bacterium A049]